MIEFTQQLSSTELIKLKDFEKKHDKCYAGAIGGKMSYIMTPTGIGVLCSVKCNICDKELTLNTESLN